MITELALKYVVKPAPLEPWLQLLMLLPLVPVAFFLVALGRKIRDMDELQRRITLESSAIAFILTLVLLVGLQSAGISGGWLGDNVGTLMLFFWACAYVFSVRRYR
jgi:hypothetical protein